MGLNKTGVPAAAVAS